MMHSGVSRRKRPIPAPIAQPGASLRIVLVLTTLASAIVAPTGWAGEAAIRDAEGTGGGGADPSAERILAEVNQPPPAPGRLERLTAAMPPGQLTSGLERAIDPQVLKRFGGPGLDLEALREAVNADLRQGGRPHVVLAAGIAAHAGLAQVQRLRLPHVRIGAVGPGYGLASRSRRATAGFYVAPPATVDGELARGVSVRLRGLTPQWPAPVAGMELTLAGEERPDPVRPGATHLLRVGVPLLTGGVRVHLGGTVAAIRDGSQRSHITGISPSLGVGRVQVSSELRRIETDTGVFLDAALQVSLPSLRGGLRLRQDPGHRQSPAVDFHLQTANLLPPGAR